MPKIYKVTNLKNNKIYIGQTNGKNSSYKGSGKLLKRAFKKYGKNNFIIETITEGNFNKTLLDSLEIHYIHLYNSRNSKIGYNIHKGGEGNNKDKKPVSLETRIKQSLAAKGNKNMLGFKHSKETRLKMSLSKRGRKLSDEKLESFREKMKLIKRKKREYKARPLSYKPIYCINIYTNERLDFNSTKTAAEFLHIKTPRITNALTKENSIVNKTYKFYKNADN